MSKEQKPAEKARRAQLRVITAQQGQLGVGPKRPFAFEAFHRIGRRQRDILLLLDLGADAQISHLLSPSSVFLFVA
jgi:hypothetical protein